MKTIVITGAAGGVATYLRHELGGDYALKLTDLRAVEGLDEGETFQAMDLADFEGLRAFLEGADGVIHLGGVATENTWETILEANIIGARNVFEAAKLAGVERVVYASSNHAVGFYRRDQTIGVDVTPRPDTRYGLSKAFGESLGALYADKYGLRVMAIRIGNVDVAPADARRLATWISPRDLGQLVKIGLEHAELKFEIVYGMSDNKRAWWDNENARRLGYAPADRSEDFAAEILARGPGDAGGHVNETYQGGPFVDIEDGGGGPPPKLPG